MATQKEDKNRFSRLPAKIHSLIAGKKYYRMIHGEHFALLLTFIKLPFAIKIFVLSILSGGLRQVLLYFHTAGCKFDIFVNKVLQLTIMFLTI